MWEGIWRHGRRLRRRDAAPHMDYKQRVKFVREDVTKKINVYFLLGSLISKWKSTNRQQDKKNQRRRENTWWTRIFVFSLFSLFLVRFFSPVWFERFKGQESSPSAWDWMRKCVNIYVNNKNVIFTCSCFELFSFDVTLHNKCLKRGKLDTKRIPHRPPPCLWKSHSKSILKHNERE